MPGDKSITHRALLLAALAPGESVIRAALTAEDAQSTARVLRQLGAIISPLGADVRVTGHAALQESPAPLDCGNSGTTARLLLGVLAAHAFTTTVTGDASLQRRPMRRVIDPLAEMGAVASAPPNGGLPITIRGGALRPLDWHLPVASAQIKSALLLAGAIGRVPVTLHEIAGTRDHTERMLRGCGFEIESRDRLITLRPTGAFVPFEIDIPGDPSSAIFLLAAAALADAGELTVAGVGLNPTRTGFIGILGRMGVAVAISASQETLGEPRGAMSAGASQLRAVTVDQHEVPGVIDEIPMLACLAARAAGTSRFCGLAELRHKESDRLALMADNLRAVGVEAAVEQDDLVIAGTSRPLSGRIITRGDHRIAMAFAVLGTARGMIIDVDDPACAGVSFPEFASTLAGIFRS